MFIIKSFIHNPNTLINNFKEVKKNPLYYFIAIDNTKEILRIKKDLDLDYIEGAIYLTYNGITIIDFTAYDLIDQLWIYFLNMINELLEKKKSMMYFPDQPIPMSMEEMPNNYILFYIDVETPSQWKLPKYEFLRTLLFGAKDFFEKMILLIEEEKQYYVTQLNKIKLLELKINNLQKNEKSNIA